jgi:hypothetical protein
MSKRSEKFAEGRIPTPAEFVEIFPTPCSNGAGGSNAAKKWKQLLNPAKAEQTETWRTPQASDWKHTGYSEEALARRRAKGRQLSLAEQVRELYPTPTCQDAKNNGAKSQQERNTKPLNAVVGGALNPTWVEWLMGWPLGWTDLKHLATARFRSWLQQHSKSLNKD